MTAQEIFDRVWRHFVTEGNPRSVVVAYEGGSGACAYRGDNGARCAVGLFIPDAEYIESMEGQCVGAVLGPTIRGLLAEGHGPLLNELQDAHDSGADGMADTLSAIARFRGLAVPS